MRIYQPNLKISTAKSCDVGTGAYRVLDQGGGGGGDRCSFVHLSAKYLLSGGEREQRGGNEG